MNIFMITWDEVLKAKCSRNSLDSIDFLKSTLFDAIFHDCQNYDYY